MGFGVRHTIKMIEKSKKKVFRVYSSKKGGEWLTRVLRRLHWMEEGKGSKVEAERLVCCLDRHAELVLIVVENAPERFAKFDIFLLAGVERKVGLCLLGGSGWRRLADVLDEFLSSSTRASSPAEVLGEALGGYDSWVFSDLVFGSKRFADVVRGYQEPGREGGLTRERRVEVFFQGWRSLVAGVCVE